ncbi:MAG: hypothetical protein N2315_03440 [Thermanaerothrix sp.]|nr:hypothetical protein [Thermanaerothrix sp.]
MDRKVDPLTGVNPVEPIRPKRNPKGAPGKLKRRWEDLLEEEERKGNHGHRPQRQEDDGPPPSPKTDQESPAPTSGGDPKEVLRQVKESPLPFLEAHRPKEPKGKVLNSIG